MEGPELRYSEKTCVRFQELPPNFQSRAVKDVCVAPFAMCGGFFCESVLRSFPTKIGEKNC